MERSEAREIVKDEREERREALLKARDLPGKLGRRAAALFMDRERFEEWVEERGGDEGAIRWVCSQVSSEVRLKVICEQYGLEYGLLWEWMSREKERLERYYRAQVGVADAWVAEVVGIADGADSESLAVDKWRGEARLKVGALYDRARFGAKEVQLGAGLENLAAVLERISERRRGIGVSSEASVSDAEVVDVQSVRIEAVAAGVVAVEGVSVGVPEGDGSAAEVDRADDLAERVLDEQLVQPSIQSDEDDPL